MIYKCILKLTRTKLINMTLNKYLARCGYGGSDLAHSGKYTFSNELFLTLEKSRNFLRNNN